MRFNLNTALLILLALLTVILIIPAENRNTLTAPHSLTIPGVSSSVGVPVGTYLLLGWLLTAVLYTLLNSFSRLRREADSARMLRDMESLRANLDAAEGSRFTQLQAYLDRRLNELQAPQGVVGGVSLDKGSLDAVRQELKGDVARLEAYLHRKLGE